jgi:hypothetical protein
MEIGNFSRGKFAGAALSIASGVRNIDIPR